MNKRWVLIFFLTMFLALALGTLSALAQQGYLSSWWTADSGGQLSEGGYTLNSTIGQPEAAAPLSASDYSLRGGFLQPPHANNTQIYLPVVER